MRVSARALVFMLWAASLACTAFLVGALVQGASGGSGADGGLPEGGARPLSQDGLATGNDSSAYIQGLLWAGALTTALAMVILFILLSKEIRRERDAQASARGRRELLRDLQGYAREKASRKNN